MAYTTDVQNASVGYYSVITDYRKYLRVGLLSALALRGTVWYNDGKEALRYIIGGSWDLRGWPRWSIRGQQVWIGSAELRFPLIDEIALFPSSVGIRFGGFRGALFADFGSARDDRYIGTVGSVGAGVRLNFARMLGWYAVTHASGGQWVAVDLRCDFLRLAGTGPHRVVARCLRVGKVLAVADVEIAPWDDPGRPVAVGRAQFARFYRLRLEAWFTLPGHRRRVPRGG